MSLQPHPRITIDGSSLARPHSDNYEYDVNGVLMTMKLSLVGVALIDSLTRSLLIRPYAEGGQNAKAVASDRLAAEVAGQQSHTCKDGAVRVDSAGNPLMGTALEATR
ncbi:hypothetical protein Pan44_28460 [Caulifigura coniformis]|uniref:Uncharacterized protein n=1 Tax=Caulifigura coniformis TaxID=2527983 RepID=A0A517SFC4_9PLAN|nr:hypothetical protein [Caulifigura coniformis]QDT54808.1 hypothetical protein Pan44_28460 [Caulifigura coniformis]